MVSMGLAWETGTGEVGMGMGIKNLSVDRDGDENYTH